MLRGIFFDLDDTLICYRDAVYRSLCTVLAHPLFNEPGITAARLFESMSRCYQEKFGYGTPGYARLAHLSSRRLQSELTEHSLQSLGLPATPALIDTLVETYCTAERGFLHPFPDTESVLQCLRPALRLGIITNGPSQLQREKLEQLGLRSWFDMVIVDCEFGAPKPDPGIFAHAATQVGLKSGELLFVGDSMEADIVGAQRSGWTSVHLQRYPDEEEGGLADFTIHHLSELLLLPPVRDALELASNANLADTVVAEHGIRRGAESASA